MTYILDTVLEFDAKLCIWHIKAIVLNTLDVNIEIRYKRPGIVSQQVNLVNDFSANFLIFLPTASVVHFQIYFSD